jgi:hypothetical protein
MAPDRSVSVAHSAPYLIGIGGAFPGVKAAGAEVTTHFHLVFKLRKRGAVGYLHCPICLNDVHRDSDRPTFT